MGDLPAITVYQPWASLIAAGAKPYEWRGWPAPRRMIGRRIAIHAGARKALRSEMNLILLDLKFGDAGDTSLIAEIALPLLRRWYSSPDDLPLSSVLCTAVLGEPIRASDYAQAHGADSDRVDHTKWGWPLTAIEVLEPFVPANGMQGFWTWRRPMGDHPAVPSLTSRHARIAAATSRAS
jgi:hypothetical protein